MEGLGLSRVTYDHIHRYVATSKSLKQYRCTVEKCHHVLNVGMLIGRQAECPDCEKPFIITEEHLRRKTIKHIKLCAGDSVLGDTSNALKPVGGMPTDSDSILNKMRDFKI